MDTERKESIHMKVGIAYTFSAYVAWGLLPLYWKLLQSVSSEELLAHRIFWSFLFVAVLLFFKKRWQSLKEVIKDRKRVLFVFLCALLISCNWFIYIWAVNHGHIIEASLGYYINPLISVLLGMIVLRERLNAWQKTALLLATIGVAILTIQYGTVPWISLCLALSFAFYGLAKKLIQVDALTGLALETLMVFPFSFFYLLFAEVQGTGHFISASPDLILLIIGTGVITALPLLWFALGARVVPLSTIGFLQYLAPTISLILGVFLYKESFTVTHMISFSFIWIGLILYTLSYTRKFQKVDQRPHSVEN
ncbi:chloramphenicol-sensitive protein RarD [Thermoflavimicrobium dichotomicum]|uniref:Chloramphenicol-sensitive protein RarD n=2 Tax=Thermoflavimicrobium dichotomicum TaxID=46223 RepID=A0A1I3TDE2_9BACL|nr:chloramphenicol-sensitive protein RarD [Thermoflavimicrobium dichotomicum]